MKVDNVNTLRLLRDNVGQHSSVVCEGHLHSHSIKKLSFVFNPIHEHRFSWVVVPNAR